MKRRRCCLALENFEGGEQVKKNVAFINKNVNVYETCVILWNINNLNKLMFCFLSNLIKLLKNWNTGLKLMIYHTQKKPNVGKQSPVKS